jgi:hypothetical protein
VKAPTMTAKAIVTASVAVAAIVTIGMAVASGGVFATAAHGPDPLTGSRASSGMGCGQSLTSSGAWGPVKADPGVAVANCPDNTRPMAVWAPPTGAVHTALGWMFRGHPLTAAEADVLRTPDGRMRLFVPDVQQIETGRPAALHSDKANGPAVDGMLEVTPAPLSANPPRPGDNSAGL